MTNTLYYGDNLDVLRRYVPDESVEALRSWHKERLGYPTQKPQALLERIIEASSNEGDVVLDPFCACGTAVAAAEKLGRRWMGIDITHLAVALMKNRLKTGFDIVPGRDYEVVGEPADVGSALALAGQDRYQFQFWAMSFLEEPTSAMRTEAVSAGFYHSDVWQRDYPKIQLRTIAELLEGNTFDLPPHPSMYQAAQRVRRAEGRQGRMGETV